MNKRKVTIIAIIATLIISLTMDPVLAEEEVGKELEGIQWTSLLESFGKFIADLFAEASSIVDKGVDNLVKLVNESY